MDGGHPSPHVGDPTIMFPPHTTSLRSHSVTLRRSPPHTTPFLVKTTLLHCKLCSLFPDVRKYRECDVIVWCITKSTQFILFYLFLCIRLLIYPFIRLVQSYVAHAPLWFGATCWDPHSLLSATLKRHWPTTHASTNSHGITRSSSTRTIKSPR